MRKKQILWNYAFDLFEDEIYNMNKICYINFHTYTEAKSAFILSEERKSSKINKSSDMKKSKDNSTGVANSENINDFNHTYGWFHPVVIYSRIT